MKFAILLTLQRGRCVKCYIYFDCFTILHLVKATFTTFLFLLDLKFEALAVKKNNGRFPKCGTL